MAFSSCHTDQSMMGESGYSGSSLTPIIKDPIVSSTVTHKRNSMTADEVVRVVWGGEGYDICLPQVTESVASCRSSDKDSHFFYFY